MCSFLAASWPMKKPYGTSELEHISREELTEAVTYHLAACWKLWMLHDLNWWSFFFFYLAKPF